MPKRRIQFDFNEAEESVLIALQRRFGAHSQNETVRRALQLALTITDGFVAAGDNSILDIRAEDGALARRYSKTDIMPT